MINQHEYIAQLIKKRLNNSLSASENTLLANWIQQQPGRKAFIDSLQDTEELFEQVLLWVELEGQDREDWLNRLEESTLAKIQKVPISVSPTSIRRFHWKTYMAAASVLLAGLLIYLFVYRSFEEHPKTASHMSLEQILPGKNQASLTLPSGAVIPLNGQQKQLTVGDDRKLYYGNNLEPLEAIQSPLQAEDQLKLAVPRAGNYSLKLVDGTIVWLNAGSTLTFPVAFAGDARSVHLEGEAYFDVRSKITKDKQKKPFYVQTEQQRIEVKGTKFNVNAFQGEATRTTLVEGEVLVETSLEYL
ncbi:MAG: FecR family protein, partial [Sphingobacterium sp.]